MLYTRMMLREDDEMFDGNIDFDDTNIVNSDNGYSQDLKDKPRLPWYGT